MKTDQNVEITGGLPDLKSLTADGNAFVITDDNVFKLYGSLFDGMDVTVIAHGEDAKTLACAEEILEAMADKHIDRKGRLIAVGGGVVGDLGGFAAAIYMRSVEWINVPTTLLAQVDSSIGGKTGVNLKNYKNMAGAFHLPRRVIICPEFLNTLDKREILCGLGEAYKSALLDSACMTAWEGYLQNGDMYEIVSACARFKEGVAADDFKESGRRKILNLGHTAGHAIEYLDAHKRSHGEYVIMGLLLESGMARVGGKMSESGCMQIARQCKKLLSEESLAFVKSLKGGVVAAAALSDKKNEGKKVSVIISDNFIQKEYFYTQAQFAEDLDKCISLL